MVRKIEISHRTIVFTAVFGLFLWLLYLIRDIILLFFISLLIMTILNPLVSRLSKWKVPRGVSVFLVYVLFFGIFGVIVGGIVPPLIEQTASFTKNLPNYLEELGVAPAVSQQIVGELLARIGSLPEQLLKVGFSVFSNLLNVIAVLVFTFYLLVSRGKLNEQLGAFFGEEKEKKIGAIIDGIEKKLGGWARGQLALMILVGVSTYAGLRLLGIPYALPLALLAGVLEIVPYLGPVVAAIPAIIIGLSISPLMGLAATALAFLIQQVENYVFVPKVMEKSVGVSPIIVLLALAIGSKLAGIVGMAISIPVVITVRIFLEQSINRK